MIMTVHSFERVKERIGMNPKAAEHFMRNALERGKDKIMFAFENYKVAESEGRCLRVQGTGL